MASCFTDRYDECGWFEMTKQFHTFFLVLRILSRNKNMFWNNRDVVQWQFVNACHVRILLQPTIYNRIRDRIQRDNTINTTMIANPPRSTARLIIEVICAIFLPPLAVFLECHLHAHFWLNIALLFFTFWIGAVIHAFYVIIARPVTGHGTFGKTTTTYSSQQTATYA